MRPVPGFVKGHGLRCGARVRVTGIRGTHGELHASETTEFLVWPWGIGKGLTGAIFVIFHIW